MRRQWILMAAILLAIPHLPGQPLRDSRLQVQVRPAMLLTQVDATSVELLVRLSPSQQALVWRADNCAVTHDDAHVVAQNGRTRIDVAALGNGRYVCVVSTDGQLSQSLAIAFHRN